MKNENTGPDFNPAQRCDGGGDEGEARNCTITDLDY